MFFEIALTLFLVFLNSFFVAAEFAIVKVRSSQIALQKETLSKKTAQNIIKNLDGFLAATQLGITLASLGLGWVGEDVTSEIIMNLVNSLGFDLAPEVTHRIAIPVAFVIITVLHIVFGELAPKTLAIRYSTGITLTVSVPLKIFYFIFRPFILLLNGLANLILKIFGVKPVSETEIHTEEELKMIISESEEGGAIEPEERDLIQNVFDFDDRTVKQVMVHRTKITSLSVGLSLQEALDIIIREGYSRYPVYGKSADEIIGVVHAKDVIAQYFSDSQRSLRDIMKPALFVSETKAVDHLLREFQRKKVQMAIVIDEYGETQGIVTLEDVLEELVGEIQDEHDQEQQVVIQNGKNRFQILARSSLHDINKYLDAPIPESDNYDTLAGMFIELKPYDLKEGAEFTIEPYHFKIIKMYRTLPEIVEAELIIR